MSLKNMEVQEFIDSIPFGWVQKVLLMLCFTIVAIDGFDTASIGFIAPILKIDWTITPSQMATLFASGLIGLTLGALFFGPLADRIGRKKILLLSILLFGLGSLISSFSPNFTILLLLRLITGIGLGGAMPSAITLMSEYCPSTKKSFFVTLMFCGFTIGSALGGLVSAQLIPMIGWRGIFFIGGFLPLILLPIFYFYIPESLRFKVLKQHPQLEINTLVQKLAPASEKLTKLYANHAEKATSSIKDLFSVQFSSSTILIWLTYFMSLMVIYLISSWLPTLLTNTGISLKSASIVTSVFQIGGTIGSILLGYWMDKFGGNKILSIAYTLGAISVIISGIFSHSILLLILGIFAVGFFISGAQTGLNAYAANFYPTNCRATGVSWANAIGRSGSVAGSFVGGCLMGLDLDIVTILSLLAIPTLIASTTLYILKRKSKTGIPVLV
ncbi:MFS transporter [Acinetobacter pragensis]|uniref:4-hydroxybenzoate transporter n=1 Tax=Acinetobacter pragensis TaxID=1806892 RepID=A0A151Y3X8_9GAMM|nr:aromatic acid/H+ symport family MFS transporter [Acinetobacter pragensis]KYQ72744.1 4-hydroxybenzoate transporter [Acinetobacter pragensis]